MKRKKMFFSMLFVALFVFVFFAVIPLPAATLSMSNGFGEWLAVVFSWEHLGEIFALILGFMVLAAATKYKKLIEALGDIVSTYMEAKEADSPGGKKMTKEEKSVLFDAILKALKQMLDVFAGGLISKIGGVFTWIGRKIF